MNRRSFLAALGGVVATGVAGVALAVGEEGRVFWREMAADTPAGPGTLRVVVQSIDDGRVHTEVDPAYRGVFGDGTGTPEPSGGPPGTTSDDGRAAAVGDGGLTGATVTVPRSLHERLRERYGRGEPYYLVRYRPHDCDGLPGNESGGVAEVSRERFNDLALGECARFDD